LLEVVDDVSFVNLSHNCVADFSRLNIG
jgi:hypothetical protein